MIKVHYCPLKPPEIDGYDIVREVETEYHTYQECPVWKHKFNRTFVVNSPIHFSIFVQNGKLVYDIPKHFPVVISDATELESNHPIIQLKFPLYYFWTDADNLWFEMLDHPMSSLNNNMYVIGGWWNLADYPRSISVAIKIVDNNKPVIIEKGDPLYRVRFYSNNLNDGFKLIKNEYIPPNIHKQRVSNDPKIVGSQGMNKRLFENRTCPIKKYLNL